MNCFLPDNNKLHGQKSRVVDDAHPVHSCQMFLLNLWYTMPRPHTNANAKYTPPTTQQLVTAVDF